MHPHFGDQPRAQTGVTMQDIRNAAQQIYDAAGKPPPNREFRIHGEQERAALDEFFERAHPEPFSGMIGNLLSIPIYEDATVPEGVLRFIIDGVVIEDVPVR